MNNIPITVIGNVATDPHRRDAPGGPVTSFRVASTDRRYDKAAGQWRDGDTSFFSVSCWRALGDRVHGQLKKGDPVVVVGRLHVREWKRDDRTGTTADIDADVVGPDLRRIGAALQRSSRRPVEELHAVPAPADPVAEPAA